MAHLKSTTAYVYDNLNAPVGTKMVFNQTASPLGWTKSTSSNDVSLRLVSGTVGTGGTVAFETCFASVTPTISQPTASGGGVQSHTLTEAELDAHKHVIAGYQTGTIAGNFNMMFGNATGGWGNCNTSPVQDTGSSSGHTHGLANQTISQPTCSAVNLDVSYVDVMISAKD